MDINFDQRLGLSGALACFGDAQTFDLDAAYRCSLCIGNEIKQAVDADPGGDDLFMAVFGHIIMFQRLGVISISLPQSVDPTVTRYRSKPGQEGAGRVVACALSV